MQPPHQAVHRLATCIFAHLDQPPIGDHRVGVRGLVAQNLHRHPTHLLSIVLARSQPRQRSGCSATASTEYSPVRLLPPPFRCVFPAVFTRVSEAARSLIRRSSRLASVPPSQVPLNLGGAGADPHWRTARREGGVQSEESADVLHLLSRDSDHRVVDPAQWDLRDVRDRGRLCPACPAATAGRARRPIGTGRACVGGSARPLPLNGSDRHHAHRDSRRRLRRRVHRRADWRSDCRHRAACALRRAHRRWGGGAGHHLLVARPWRTRSEAVGAREPRGHRPRRCPADDGPFTPRQSRCPSA